MLLNKKIQKMLENNEKNYRNSNYEIQIMLKDESLKDRYRFHPILAMAEEFIYSGGFHILGVEIYPFMEQYRWFRSWKQLDVSDHRFPKTMFSYISHNCYPDLRDDMKQVYYAASSHYGIHTSFRRAMHYCYLVVSGKLYEYTKPHQYIVKLDGHYATDIEDVLKKQNKFCHITSVEPTRDLVVTEYEMNNIEPVDLTEDIKMKYADVFIERYMKECAVKC